MVCRENVRTRHAAQECCYDKVISSGLDCMSVGRRLEEKKVGEWAACVVGAA